MRRAGKFVVARLTRSSRWISLACGLALAGPCAGAAQPKRPKRATTEAHWRLDARWAADRAVQIEWRDTWDATAAANREKWNKELAAAGRERDARMRVRMITLLEALVAKYPDDRPRHAQAYQDIVSYLRAMNYHASATEYAKRLVDASAGNGPAVADALHGLVRGAEQSPPESVEWAARRILALNAVGQVGDAEPAVIAAHLGLAVAKRRRGQFMEAAEALEAYARQAGQTETYRLEEAQLYADAGHVDEALLRLQSLALEGDEGGLRTRIGQLAAGQSLSAGRFAGNEALTVKWSILKLRPPADPVAEYAPLMTDDAGGQNVVPTDEGRFASLWVAAGGALLATKPETLAGLRGQQEAEAARRVEDSRGAIETFRRFPFATASHRLLLEHGESALRRGHAMTALRSFEDVISHAADAKLIEQAKAGVELARAQVRSSPAAGSAALHGTVTTLRTPGVPAWPAKLVELIPGEVLSRLDEFAPSIQVVGPRTIVAAPGFIACYGDDPLEPLWTQTPRLVDGDHGRVERADVPYFTVPGPFEPAADAKTVYSRWGADAAGRFMTGVAAFDVETGSMRWSTDQQDDARSLRPLGDPCVGDGRIYYLALDAAAGENAIGSALVFACLDAADGRVIFRKRVGDLSLAIPLQGERDRREGEDGPPPQADLVHYGNRLTFADGRVYASSNMGLVACFDGRDGMMGWARTYGRARLTIDSSPIYRRQGAPPVVAGDRVIFLPRDRNGAFAVDRATGAIAWDRPFAPSERVVSLVGDVLVLCDEDHLVGLRVADGLTLWTRPTPERGTPPPIAAGGHVLLAARDRLVRVDARTGVTLEDRTLDDVAEPPRALALREGVLLAIDDRSAAPPDPTTTTTLRVAAPDPTLRIPPPSANLGRRVFVESADALHGVDPADAKSAWRRTLRPGLREVEWVDGALLLVYAGAVECVDGTTGNLRWQTPLPIGITHSAVAAGVLVLAAKDVGRDPALAGVEIATGQVLWQRVGTSESERAGDLVDVRSDGAHVHLVARRGERGGLADFVLRPADGAVAELRDLAAAGRNVSKHVRFDGTNGAAIGGDALSWFTLDANAPAALVDRRDLALPQYVEALDLRLAGPYATYRTTRRDVTSHFVVKRGDPAFRLQRPSPGIVRGERLYEPAGRTLTVIDLATRRQALQCVVPVPESVDHHVDILDFWEDGAGAIHVLSGLERGSGRERTAVTLRLDTFDAKTGGHRAGNPLDRIPYWRTYTTRTDEDNKTHLTVRRRTQVLRAGDTVLLTASDGLHAISAASPTSPLPTRICYRASPATPPTDWKLNDAGATLSLAHDGDELTLVLTHPDDRVSPRLGHALHAGGDRLEVGLTTHLDSYRFAVGVDHQGRPAFENLSTTPLPPRLAADVRHDLVHGAHVYRVTIPLKNITNRNGASDWRSVGLSLAAYDDAGGGTPRTVAALGQALDGKRLIPQRHVPLYLHPLTPAEELAAHKLAQALPDLPASRQYVDRLAAARGSSPVALAGFFRALLKADPAGPGALRTMQALDLRLRTLPEDDTTRRVLELAGECGVPGPVRKQYEQSASAYLSQWVRMDPQDPPRMLMLQFRDARGWEHRVSYGQFHSPWTGVAHTPSRRVVGRLPPAGAWHELRIPLVWLGLHDEPIHGVSFAQLGGKSVLWDRTAVVTPDGRETILIDDDLPDSATGGFWDWASEPAAKSGSKSHTYVGPPTADQWAWHDVVFKAPFARHVPPTDAAAEPARALATIEQHLPALGPTDVALDFLRAAVSLDPDPRDRYRWWLKTMPAHPRNAEVLADLLAHLRASKVENPEAAVDALIDELKIPPRTRYAYRRSAVFPQRTFLTEWHVLGGFPNPDDRGLDYPFPPESEGRARLDAEYRGATEAIRWKPVTAPRDYVDLLAAGLTPNEQAVAYAVCWVHTDKARAASLELGHDDGCRAWLNRRLVHSVHEHDVAERGEFRVPVFLPAGWSELLIKVEQNTADWGFFAELVDPEGRGPLPDVKVSGQPPNR